MTLPLSRSQTLGVIKRRADDALSVGPHGDGKDPRGVAFQRAEHAEESGSHTFSAWSQNACVSVFAQMMESSCYSHLLSKAALFIE
jgi:hypothetical protein